MRQKDIKKKHWSTKSVFKVPTRIITFPGQGGGRGIKFKLKLLFNGILQLLKTFDLIYFWNPSAYL